MSGGWIARVGPSRLDIADAAAARHAELGNVQVVLSGEPDNAGGPEDVLDAYLRDGEAVLSRLRGAFALVIRDGRSGTALCVRDPLGVHPLFAADDGSDMLVSSSIATLLAHGISRELNVPALADHVVHRWPDPTETYFTSVRRIPPGHVLRLDGSRRSSTRYWHPLPEEDEPRWVSENELLAFDDLLERAVEASVRENDAGIFLSGGLDSVSVAAVAAADTRERTAAAPTALSLVFPDPDVDESAVQRGVAKILGLEHVLMSWDEAVGANGIVHEALELSARADAPLLNLWASAYDRLARAGAARGCSVILTGAGGDEWLGVSPLYAADLLRRLDVVGLYRLIAAQRRSYHVADIRFVCNAVWRFGGRLLVADAVARTAPELLTRRRRRRAVATTPPWLAPAPELRRTLLERAVAADGAVRRGTRSAFYLDAVRRSLDHTLVSVEMEETFAQSSRAGVAIRAPYWDADLLEFLCRTPPDLLNRGGRAKGLVRDAVARRFPELGFDRQRKVNSLRFAMSLFAAELPRAWAQLGGPKALVEAGVVDSDFLTAERPRLSMQMAWNILNLEVWVRSHQ